MKKILSAVICVLILTVYLCISASALYVTDPSQIKSGSIGEALTWSFDPYTDKLTISGNGAIPDFENEEDRPWHSFEIRSIKISEGVTEIGNNAFSTFRTLNELSIPTSVTRIGDSAFHYSVNLSSIDLPNGLKVLGKGAFSDCSRIVSIEIPGGVTEISDNAFSHCTKLSRVTIPEGVEVIGKSAFSYCEKLSKIDLPKSIRSIGESAFAGCESLQSAFLPKDLEHLGDAAFEFCKELKTVSLPKSITVLGAAAFYDADLEALYYSGSEEEYKEIKVLLGEKYIKITESGNYKDFNVVYDCCGEHKLDNVTTVEAGHAKDGYIAASCTECVATAYEKLDMTEPHLFKDPTVTREPTHTEFGIETYHCACGATKDINIAKTEEHEWNDSRVKKEATENEEGIIVYYCPCGERKSENIPKLSANTTAEVTTEEATTTANASSGGCQGSADIYLASLIPLAAGVVFLERKKKNR